MAEATVELTTDRQDDWETQWQENYSVAWSSGVPFVAADSRRWNDYGIGLLEQAQYGPASDAFRRASEIDPSDPNLLVNAAIAELRTERYGPERAQLGKAAALLDRALKLDPTRPRSRYWQSVVLRSGGKLQEAAGIPSQLATEYPARARLVARFWAARWRRLSDDNTRFPDRCYRVPSAITR